jgi:methionine salvage enolase-phosphatase E1
METAQSKFDEILNSESLEEVCSKINRLAKSKELDSSLILLINRAWAAAKESTSMKNEVCVKMSLYHWHVTLFLYLMGSILTQTLHWLYPAKVQKCVILAF